MTAHPASCVCTRCCDRDVMRDNPIYAAERQEAAAAVADLTEMQRVQTCGHTRRRRGVCPDCGNTIDWSEA